LNLLFESWIPTRRISGTRQWIAPWQLTEGIDSDPIIALDYARPDLSGSMAQFLIGLLQTITPDLADEDDWWDHYESPPSPQALREWLAPWALAFELDGDGPRFMQDFDAGIATGEPESISGLLMDAPGGNTLKLNTDHFIKRDGLRQLSPELAAAALFSLQLNAPSGGQGHRTSLRGGGPLTTLVQIDPRQPDASLWRSLWLNVLDWSRFSGRFDCEQPQQPCADIFPWLAATRTSNLKAGGVSTTLEDVHPLQMYWGMPRRIRLDFAHTTNGDCDLGGPGGDALLCGYHTKNFGINYDGPWQHPLSPHYFDKQGTPMPLHASPAGLQYRHWLGLVQSGPKSSAARVVSRFFGERRDFSGQFSLWAFGYDMDNMKARGWHEARLPLYPLPDPTALQSFENNVAMLVEAAVEVRGYLQSAVKQAWFKRPGDAKGDTGAIDLAFWRASEADFYAALDSLHAALTSGAESVEAREALRKRWYDDLRGCAKAQFDHWATRGDASADNLQRIALARRTLLGKLNGKPLRKKLDISTKTTQPQGGEHATA